MLGETDESHIIRTIEYWERVKRQWPQRQHYAVLVAESITRRFFNVIQLLSQNVPLIAIQANIVEVNGNKALTFTKVLDVYEEPGEPGSEIDEITTEDDWRKKAPWTLETATALLEIAKPIWGEVSLGFTKSSITLRVNQNNYFWFHKRSSNKSRLNFRIDRENLDKASGILDEAGVAFPVVKANIIRVIVDRKMIQDNAERLRDIANLVRQYWEG